MGTSLHRYHPTDKDWGYAPNGKSLMNLSDALVYTHPEWIAEIHRGFLAAGCDAVETNTFNATQIVLDEFGMGDKLDEINRLNIRIAKDVAAEFSTPGPPAVRRRLRRPGHQDAVAHRPRHLRRLRHARRRVPPADPRS